MLRGTALLDQVHPLLVNFAKLAESSLPYDLTVTEGFRSLDKQAALYAQGRTAPGNIVTNAKPGTSAHNYGLAIDVAVIIGGRYAPDDDPAWDELGELAERQGLKWGGRFHGLVDKPHIEMPDWQGMKDWNPSQNEQEPESSAPDSGGDKTGRTTIAVLIIAGLAAVGALWLWRRYHK